MLVLACRKDAAVSGDHCRPQQVVEREPVRRRQVPDAAAQRQSGDSGVAEGSARRREAVPLTGGVEILPERAAAACRRPRLRIDDDLAHQAQVDDEAPVADAMARDAVSTAADRDRKIRFAREPHSSDDVGEIDRPHDQLRMSFDHPVEGRARFVEAAVVRIDDRPAMPFSQLTQRVHGASLGEVTPGG
jgi:hypothetical protein